MTKKIFLGLIALFFLVSGCITQPGPIVRDCPDIQDTGDRDLCFMKKAIEEYNINYCNEISYQELKEGCPVWAEEYDSYSAWHTYYIETPAEFTGCPPSPGGDFCRMERAIENNDVTYCNAMVDQDLSQGCPLWITEYDNYDNWYAFYVEGFYEIQNPPEPHE